MINDGASHTFLLVFSEILTNEVGHKSALSIIIECIEKKSKSLNEFVLFLYVFYTNKAPPNISFQNFERRK